MINPTSTNLESDIPVIQSEYDTDTITRIQRNGQASIELISLTGNEDFIEMTKNGVTNGWYIGNDTSNNLKFGYGATNSFLGSTEILKLTNAGIYTTGNIIPSTTNDLGTTLKKFGTLYVNNVNSQASDLSLTSTGTNATSIDMVSGAGGITINANKNLTMSGGSTGASLSSS